MREAAVEGQAGGSSGAAPAVAVPGKATQPESGGAREESAQAQAGGGQPLPEQLKGPLEQHLGADLSMVRVHTDSHAAAAARQASARAFALGTDIFFAAGAFDPSSPGGKHLLAHEVTHVVQHQQGRSGAGDVEGEADASADQLGKGDAWLKPWAQKDHRKGGAGRVAATDQTHPLLRKVDVNDQGLKVPEGGTQVNELGIVSVDGETKARLRKSMSTGAANVVKDLDFNTPVQVMQLFTGGWLLVALRDGTMGYVAKPSIWYPPDHVPPEPNAKLHKVASGEDGFAINIVRKYYGTDGKWGEDERFFVNVIGSVNHQKVPDTTAGWKTVHFNGGVYIWIPSLPFAKSMHSVLNSGSYTYNAASALGVEGLVGRGKELWHDFKSAISKSGKYIGPAIKAHVEASLVSILESLAQMAIGAVLLLALSTAVGAMIGGPAGAAAGFEVGMVLMEWLGLAFLVKWIGDSLLKIGGAFVTFFKAVWNARGDNDKIDAAAHDFAEAIGTVCGVAVEALVMWAISAGTKGALGKLKSTRFGQALGDSKTGEWLEERAKNVKDGKAKLPTPKQALAALKERLARARKGEKTPLEVKTTGPDAYDAFGEKHKLDPAVVETLRTKNVDLALVEKLLGKGIDPFDIADTALAFGNNGVKAIDAVTSAGVAPKQSAEMFASLLKLDPVDGAKIIDLINSGTYQNLKGLPKFIQKIMNEHAQGMRGSLNALEEAGERAAAGDKVTVEGKKKNAADKESGQADVVDYTKKQAVQMKTVTSPKSDKVVSNLQAAVDQLAGKNKEMPPDGYQRVAEIRIDGPENPLRKADRPTLLSALKGQMTDLDGLSPKDTTPGIIKIVNAIGTFIFQPSELK